MPTERRIAEALAAIETWVDPQGPPGVGAAVWHRGEIVAERYAGFAAAETPVTADTLFSSCFGDQADLRGGGDGAGRRRSAFVG